MAIIRLGDLLVIQGSLTEQQRDEILAAQRDTIRPFGALAEELFGINPADVEAAWASQYAAMSPASTGDDGSTPAVDPDALGTLDRRQAWQFAICPLHEDDAELVLATTREHLPRALRFVGWRLTRPSRFEITDRQTLGRLLEAHYPMGGARAVDLLPAERIPVPTRASA